MGREEGGDADVNKLLYLNNSKVTIQVGTQAQTL
ncbi:MAG: hypothetical protein DDT25_00641 [Chloroflexi bacterium]|nr:hypothetical protein [Chloroflexota bacterium]